MTTKAKLNPKWAASRRSHAAARKKLKRLGLCAWRCGTKINKKVSISLCPGCFKLQRERRQERAKRLKGEK